VIRLATALVVGLLATVATSPAMLAAQQQPQPVPTPSPTSSATPSNTGRLTPLKVQLVVTRTLGDKKVSSLPYVLWVTANDRQATSLRMGVEVPIVTTMISAGNPVPSYNYRPIGTNIDCIATTFESSYNLNITLSDSSIQFDPKDASAPTSSRVADAPAFRSFTSKFSILLKDGQTAQYTSATDPVNGETLKVDVTLNVLK
jgi:hypothetical protein